MIALLHAHIARVEAEVGLARAMDFEVLQLLTGHVALVVQGHHIGNLAHDLHELDEIVRQRVLAQSEVLERFIVASMTAHVHSNEETLLVFVDDSRLLCLEEVKLCREKRTVLG